MASGTRSRKKIWLIGSPSPTFSGQKLPSKGEVLRYLMFHHVEMKESLSESVRKTADSLHRIWTAEGITTKYLPGIVRHVQAIHSTWQGLKKSKNRKSSTNTKNQDEFSSTLGELFDIAHANAMALIKIPEDREFLAAQREKGRRGKIGPSVDKKLAETSKKIEMRKAAELKRRKKETDEMAAASQKAYLESSTSSSSESSPMRGKTAGPTSLLESPPPKRQRGTISITSGVAAALDRTSMSDRSASRVLVPFAKQLGQNVGKLSLSPSAIRAARMKNRKERAFEIKKAFRPDFPLIVHWDGKLMEDITGRGKIDRLPILVTGDGVTKILAIPKQTDSKADNAATAILSTLQDWDLDGRVKGMCFDTTAVNTGIRNGVCVRVEKALDRQLLYFACRHHILELVLESVYSSCVGEVSQGPDITIFETFRDCWQQLDRTEFSTAADDEATNADIQPWAESTVDQCQCLLKQKHPRDDYKELLQLTVIFLGAVPHEQQHPTFMTPGAVHRARWMARAIYCLKIWMFRDQFARLISQRPSSSRTATRVDRLFSGVYQVCLFVAEHYVKAWFSARNAASAPRDDLVLLQTLETANQAAYKTMSRHLWYLNEISVGLALFDEDLDPEEKRDMVHSMNNVEGSEEAQRRIWLPNPEGKKLSDLCSTRTKDLFTLLELRDDFLVEDPTKWEQMESFKKAKERVDALNVVNDTAERGVALIQDFTRAGRTRDEEQLQFMVQVVEEDRMTNAKVAKESLAEK